MVLEIQHEAPKVVDNSFRSRGGGGTLGISEPNALIYIPYPRVNCLKTGVPVNKFVNCLSTSLNGMGDGVDEVLEKRRRSPRALVNAPK